MELTFRYATNGNCGPITGLEITADTRAADGGPHTGQYLRPFSIKDGWLAPVTQVSPEYGDPAIWPGDTFGISALPGRHVALSWGSAVGGSQNSQIYATVVGR